MEPKKSFLANLLQQEVQYQVPIFQRTYAWDKKQWFTLWTDVLDLYERESDKSERPHFIGSIVLTELGAKGDVPLYSVVDGQQRLTTMIVFSLALADAITALGSESHISFRDRYMVNQYAKNDKRYKLLPSRPDKEAFLSLINRTSTLPSHAITRAYTYFQDKVRKEFGTNVEDCIRMYDVVFNRLQAVCIYIDKDEDPYQIFESLNAKGEPLAVADLIRNYLFAGLDEMRQTELYEQYWLPMEQLLAKSKDGLSSFIRLYLMRNGKKVARYNVYSDFKLEAEGHKEHILETLHQRAQQLANLFVDVPQGVMPSAEAAWIRAMDMSSFFPLMFQFLDQYDREDLALKAKDLGRHLLNVMIRRFFAESKSNEVVRLVGAMLRDLLSEEKDTYYETLLNRLTLDLCPDDAVVAKAVPTRPLYDQPGIVVKCRTILEMLEIGYGHKEQADLTRASIEHLAPQTIGPWKAMLSDEDQEGYNEWIHTLGNLTLTGYNSELSNKLWTYKQDALNKSNYELNRYFADQPVWNRAAALARAEALVPDVLKVFAAPVELNRSEARQLARTYEAPSRPISLTLGTHRIPGGKWSNLTAAGLSYMANQFPEQFNTWAINSPYLSNTASFPLRNVGLKAQANELSWYYNSNQSGQSHLKILRTAWRGIGGSEVDFVMEYDVDGVSTALDFDA